MPEHIVSKIYIIFNLEYTNSKFSNNVEFVKVGIHNICRVEFKNKVTAVIRASIYKIRP